MAFSIGTTYEGKDFSYLKSVLPYVHHIEISPDSFAHQTGKEVALHPASIEELLWVQQNSPASLLIHGVSLSIGSYDGWSAQYIGLLEQLFNSLQVQWHSEHLAYTTVNGEPLGTMFTLPRTDEVIDMICRRVDSIQQKFKSPFLLENVINMLPLPKAKYSDAAFLNRISQLSGCGLILDIYNMECDAYNFGLNIPDFLDELDLDNVYELHLAGGLKDPEYGFMMDIHARLIADTTLSLAADVIARNPKRLKAITYELLEEFIQQVSTPNIIAELKRIDELFNNAYEPANFTN